MKVFRLAAVIALLAGPAYAQQMPNINLMPETKTLTPEEKEQEAAQQKAYRDSLKKIPDAKASNDPWGNVRTRRRPRRRRPRHRRPRNRRPRPAVPKPRWIPADRRSGCVRAPADQASTAD